MFVALLVIASLALCAALVAVYMMPSLAWVLFTIVEPARAIAQRTLGWTCRMVSLFCAFGGLTVAAVILVRQISFWHRDGFWTAQSVLDLMLEFTVTGPWYETLASWEMVYQSLGYINASVMVLVVTLSMAFVAKLCYVSMSMRAQRVWRNAADGRRLHEVAKKVSPQLEPIVYPSRKAARG